MSFVNGQGRKIIYNGTVVASNASLPTSLALGTFLVSEMAGITGMIKCDSAFGALLQVQYLPNSGATSIVTSAVAINTGSVISLENPSAYVAVGITGIASNSSVRIYLAGLPIR